jgi:uncharacterized membrane protein YgcG
MEEGEREMLSLANLSYLTIDDPVLYDWLDGLVGAFNQLQQQVGVDAAPAAQTAANQALPAPNAPASIAVSAARGTFNVTIGTSAGAAPGIQYFLEIASDPAFPASTAVYALGTTLGFSLNLGNVTRYFRARAKYPSSDYSSYIYLGTAANPNPVSGGQTTSNDILANAPSNSVNNATVDSIDAGNGTATIRIYGPGGVGSSWTQSYGQGTRSFPGGSVSGLAYSTNYYVVWDTNGQAYLAYASLDQTVSDSYVFAGKVTTVASGGTGGASGGGGSSWSPDGCTEVGTELRFPAGSESTMRVEECGHWVEIELESGERLAMAPGTLVSVFRRGEDLKPGELVEVGQEGKISAVKRAGQSWRASAKMKVRVKPQGVYWANGIRVHNMKLI